MKTKLAFALLLSVAFPVFAHPPGFHPSGDCYHYCTTPGCQAAMASNEEAIGPATCVNHAPGYQPEGAVCNNDFVGPQNNYMNCGSGGCVMSGKMKCKNIAGLPTFPPFTMDCPLKYGMMPAATLEKSEATCINPFDSSGKQAECSEDGSQVLITMW